MAEITIEELKKRGFVQRTDKIEAAINPIYLELGKDEEGNVLGIGIDRTHNSELWCIMTPDGMVGLGRLDSLEQIDMLISIITGYTSH